MRTGWVEPRGSKGTASGARSARCIRWERPAAGSPRRQPPPAGTRLVLKPISSGVVLSLCRSRQGRRRCLGARSLT
jgi:hypothetical protein